MNERASQSPLRLTVVTETYPPEINGVANTMRHLVEGFRDRGHQLYLVRPRQAGERVGHLAAPIEQTLVPGVPIPGYRGLRLGLPVYWRLRRLWGRRRPDLIYIATQGPLGHAALAAAVALRVPAVTGFHTQFQQYSRHYGLGFLTRQITNTLRQFHNRSDATLVPTAELRAELTAAGFTNVQVFGRGVDVTLFAPTRRLETLRASWGCGPDDLAVLYVGRVAAEKNLDLARETFAAIESQQPSARFVLVGDGPALAGLHRDHPRFICTGARVGEDLAAHYASGDLFLFPSLTETFGNVVTEAMASALPVVAFDYAAAHAAIVSGVNGVTAPMGDRAGFVAAGLIAIQDRGRLRALGEAARRTALHMSWERVLGGVEQLLYEVIRRRQGDPEPTPAAAAVPE